MAFDSEPDKVPTMDPMDRKLLGLLAEDATLSYKELGERLHLSAPAVHERVKKLKKSGAIRGTVARLDGEARSEEHTSELQSLMRTSHAVFCSKKKNKTIAARI